MMIQALVLPAMVTSQIYTKTLYAAQNVRAPVKISMFAMGAGIITMLVLMNFIGYLAMPVATVISGYLRNIWLVRECKKYELYKMQSKTKFAVIWFTVLAIIMGIGLLVVSPVITNLFVLIITLGLGAVTYLLPRCV